MCLLGQFLWGDLIVCVWKVLSAIGTKCILVSPKDPVLFNSYTTDLLCATLNPLYAYADDVTLIAKTESLLRHHEACDSNDDLHDTSRWCEGRSMKENSLKSKRLIFRLRINSPSHGDLLYEGEISWKRHSPSRPVASIASYTHYWSTVPRRGSQLLPGIYIALT